MFESSGVVPIVCFFLVHCRGYGPLRTVFLHGDASHGMFRLSKGCERTFYFLACVFLLHGSADAPMHRAHTYHARVHEPTLTERHFPGRVALAALFQNHHHLRDGWAPKPWNLRSFRALLPIRPARFSV